MQDKEIEDDMELGSKYSSIRHKAKDSDSGDELDVDFNEIFTNTIKGNKKNKKPNKKKSDDSLELL